MSKRTFIQKWDPHQLFKNTITRATGRRGRGYRKKTNDDLGIVCKTIYNPNDASNDPRVHWYGAKAGVSEQSEEPSQVTRGRITQRVGMFRNAKHSEVVYNDMSSAGRRAVQRDIGHIVAPEEEVEWARAPITCTLNGNNRLPYAIDDDQEINVITDAKKRLRYDPYVQNEEFVQRNRRSEPIYDGDEHPPALMRGKRRLEQNYSVRMDKHKTFEFNACSENDSCDTLRNELQDIEYSSVDSQQTQHGIISHKHSHASITRLAAEQERRMRTPGRNDTLQLTGITSSGVPFRSTEIATRILSSLPQLSLRDDESKKYDTVAVDLLAESIRKSARQIEENSAGEQSQIIRSLMDQTRRLIPANEGVEDPTISVITHENVFVIDTPGLGIESTSPPDTPNIERLFNQTVAGKDMLEVEQYVTPTRQHLDEGYPMLTPCSIDPDSLHHAHESGMSCISTDSFAPVHSANTTRRNHTIKSTPSVHSSAKNSKLTTRNRSETVSQLQFKWPCVQEPFTRCSSPSSSESDDFEWTLPPPNRDVYDIVREKQAQTITGDLNDLF